MIGADRATSDAVKIAMTLGSYSESSFRPALKPYRDALSASRPWTVCDGITNTVAGPADMLAITGSVAEGYVATITLGIAG